MMRHSNQVLSHDRAGPRCLDHGSAYQRLCVKRRGGHLGGPDESGWKTKRRCRCTSWSMTVLIAAANERAVLAIADVFP
jgi:hypothetical protein